MSFYRNPSGPFLGLTPAFLHSFALNLQNPDSGPCVPVPWGGLSGDDWSFEGRPLRNSPDVFVSIASDLAGRLPSPDHERPLSGFSPSDGGLRWYLTNRQSDPVRDRFSFTFQQKGKKTPRGRLLEVASYRGVTAVTVSVIERPRSSVTQESQWSRAGNGNTDLLRTTFFSKKGPPGWEDLPLPPAEMLWSLSLALYQTRGDKPLRVQADRHRGWMRESSDFDGPEAVSAWLETGFRNRESGSARTERQIGFVDRFGLNPRHPILYVRWFQPWKRSDWFLEINYRQMSGEASVPAAVADLARFAAGL